MTKAEFNVVGGDTIGEKAEMLREHQPLIDEVGLTTPSTTVIASETVQAVSDIPSNLNHATRNALIATSENYAKNPALAIRSSAEGDATGNGVYESRFATNAPELVLKEAGVVVESFQTESAQDFRKQATLGNAFALMVQPVIGQDLEGTEYWEHFGPYLSGYGYSSSLKNPDGYVNVVAGIGGGVSRQGGQIISAKELDTIIEDTILTKYRQKGGQPLSFYDFLYAIHEATNSGLRPFIRNDFRSGDEFFPRELVQNEAALAQYLMRQRGTTEFKYQDSGLLSAGMEKPTGRQDADGWPKFAFAESEFLQVTRNFLPHSLFEAMQRMEQIAGYPVYIEWALGAAEKELKPVILQIAPAEETSRTKLEASIQGEILADAKHILGHGVLEAQKVVVVGGPQDVEHLREFNRNPDNEGYVVMFSSAILGPYSGVQLSYGDLSKCGAILEVQAEDLHLQHSNGDVVQHLFGSSRQTDKFVGELPAIDGAPDLWQRAYTEGRKWTAASKEISHYSKHGSIFCLNGNFKILADTTNGTFLITEG